MQTGHSPTSDTTLTDPPQIDEPLTVMENPPRQAEDGQQ